MKKEKNSVSFSPLQLVANYALQNRVNKISWEDYKLTATAKIPLQTQGFSIIFWKGTGDKTTKQPQDTAKVNCLCFWNPDNSLCFRRLHISLFFFFSICLSHYCTQPAAVMHISESMLIYNNVLFVTEDKGEIELFLSIWRWWAAG